MIESYVIVMKGNDIAEDLAKDCIDSGKKFNIQVNEFSAIWGDIVNKVYEREGLRPFPNLKPFRNTQGVRGCFLSHFLLWKKCLEENKPLIIFEHDALVIRPIDVSLLDRFDDVLHLDAWSRVAPVYEDHLKNDLGNEIELHHGVTKGGKIFKKHNAASIKGLHSYIIKPSGAEKLINFSKTKGVLPADIAVNGNSVHLWKTKTSLCRINPKYWIDDKKKSSNSFTRVKD